MSAKLNWFPILLVAFLMMTMAQAARAEDYLIEVIERPGNNQFDPTNRTARYKFRIKIHPNSTLERIDGFGKICVADTAFFKWSLGGPPQVLPLQSRTDSKAVEGIVKATGDWTGQKNAYFSVALPGSECAGNGLSPAGQSNRAQESARLTPVLNIPSGLVNAGDQPTGPIARLAPYRLRVQPSIGVNSETAITLRAEPTGTGTANCKFEAVPTSGGAAWSAIRENCSEVSPTLAAGTYTLRLTMRLGRAGGGYEDLTEEKQGYVVSAAPNFAITSLVLDPVVQPAQGDITKVHMKIKNQGAETLRNLPWAVKERGNIVNSGTKSSLAPGEEFEIVVRLDPWLEGTIEATGELDPNNQLNEPAARRNDNKKTVSPQSQTMATELLPPGSFDSETILEPCAWGPGDSRGFTANWRLDCGALPNGAKQDLRMWYEGEKLKNGWKIKRVEVEDAKNRGGYRWLTKPQEGNDDPYMKIHMWVDSHVGVITPVEGGSGRKFVQVKIRVWIEGPSHLSPYEANKPRQAR
ncbi:MAG: CARDB domain-containing protein [Pyrinomonadaceae bacterium]